MVQRFHAADGEFFVHDRTNDLQFDPRVAGLTGGGFVVTWYDLHLDTVHAQRFDADGDPVGEAFAVTHPVNSNAQFDVAGLASGGFAVAWVDTVQNVGPRVKIQLYDPAGAALGPPSVLTDWLGSSGAVPSITGLASGGFVIVYDHDLNGQLGARLFNASGQPVGGEFTLADPAAGLRESPNVVALPSGGFAVTWEVYGPGNERDVRFRAFDSAGAPLGPEVVVATGIADQAAPQLTVLSSGAMVLTWEERGAADWDVRAQLFDSAGAKVGGTFLVNSVTAADQRAPTVSALGTGFVVAWTDSSGQSLDIYGTAIKAQAFDPSGQKIGGEYVVNSHKAGSQTAPVFAALADGSIAAVWVSNDNVFPSPYIALRSKVLDFVTVTEIPGTAVADVLDGSAGPDDISGLGGDDTIAGGGGDDVVLGGDGADEVDGGDGDDRIDGGIGDDRLNGGAGDDIVAAGEGEDTLVVYGSYGEPQGIDRLDGGAGNDLFDIYANWSRGSAAVTMIGGDGDDRFAIAWAARGPTHYGTGVTIDAGAGADRIELTRLDTRAELTLGAGVDTIALDEWLGSWLNLDSSSGGIYINDFVGGSGGDRIELLGFVENYIRFDWDGATNPFASGHLALEQQGADAVLLIRGRLEYDFQRLFIFRNVDVATITAANLDGIPPDGSAFPATSVTGSGNNDQLEGTLGPDTIEGLGGDDIIIGRSGHDILRGGDGTDHISGGNGGDLIEGGAGTDSIYGGLGNDTLSGGDEYDYIEGGGGDDWIDGGAGPDSMFGDGGSDTFVVDNAGDQVLEYSGYAGTDRVLSSVTHALDLEVEELVLTGSAAINGTGNILSNLILGNGGANILDGGRGDDLLDGGGGADMTIGGSGADIHRLAESGDLAVEQASGGIDRVETALASYTLTANVENLRGTGSVQTLTGNASYNEIVGTAKDDVLSGLGGDDLLIGGAGADKLIGGTGRDVLIGGTVGSTDLIVNGSFEQHEQFENSRQFILAAPTDSGASLSRTTTTLAGWSRAGGQPIELHTAGAAGAFNTAHGGTLVDLENGAGQNVAIYQDIGGIAAGTRLVLTFAAALPAGGGGARVDVYWNGVRIAAVVPTSTEMTQYAFLVTAAATGTGVGGANRLEFREANAAGDGRGTSLDLVTLRTLAQDAAASDLNGGAGHDVLLGDNGHDNLRLHDGGNDTVIAGSGNDNIFVGAALTTADMVDGGAGSDTVILQGNYAGGVTLSPNLTSIENVSILAGSNTVLGEPGTNRYDYVITTLNATFAAGLNVKVNGSALLAGEDFTFNGSAETDASFTVYGGRGVDSLTGGLGNDVIVFAEGRFGAGDGVNGGGGFDALVLRGPYAIDLSAPGHAGLMSNIENITLSSASDERYARGGGTEFDYNIILSDSMVGVGQALIVSGSLLMANETMIFDGSQESDGLLRLFGGAAADTLKGGGQADLIHGSLGADRLTGGGGADSFRYQSTAESTSAAMDRILDFTPGTDKIDLAGIDANSLAAGNQAFTWIGSNAFGGTGAASAGQLRAYQSGGDWFVEGDTNGDGNADLVIALTLQGATPLGAGDFFL